MTAGVSRVFAPVEVIEVVVLVVYVVEIVEVVLLLLLAKRQMEYLEYSPQRKYQLRFKFPSQISTRYSLFIETRGLQYPFGKGVRGVRG